MLFEGYFFYVLEFQRIYSHDYRCKWPKWQKSTNLSINVYSKYVLSWKSLPKTLALFPARDQNGYQNLKSCCSLASSLQQLLIVALIHQLASYRCGLSMKRGRRLYFTSVHFSYVQLSRLSSAVFSLYEWAVVQFLFPLFVIVWMAIWKVWQGPRWS